MNEICMRGLEKDINKIVDNHVGNKLNKSSKESLVKNIVKEVDKWDEAFVLGCLV